MKAYILNKDPRKKKFEDRTKTGIFIGYCERSKAYRVWLPAERKVVVSRDIRVIEHKEKEHEKQAPHEEREQEEVQNEIQVQHEIGHTNVDPDMASDVQATNERISALQRAPGRPKIVRTGMRGRPRKLFHYKDIQNEDCTRIPMQNDEVAEENGSNQIAEANLVMLVANMADISVKDALQGDDQEEWKRAIRTEVKCLIKNV